MISFQSSGFNWLDSADGLLLTVRTNRARAVVSEINPDKEYTVEIKEYRKKRSLDANSFYWSVLSQLAAALGTSNTELHNIMLRRYGQVERYGDQLVYVVLPDTDEAAEKADKAETYHVKPTSQVKAGKDGRMYRTYLLLRGSSTYDTKEMSVLINGLLSECKQAGLEVLTEQERALLYGVERN